MENNGASILIVEDEFMISEDIAMRLSDFGYKVAGVAASALAAIEILEKGETDLALVDINIDGDMDGIELSKIINDRFKIPFIYLTSLANKTVVERAKETLPASYLLKPFNDRQVQIAIEMALVNYTERTNPKSTTESTRVRFNSYTVIPSHDSLFLKRDSHFDRVRFSDITHIESQGNYCVVHTTNSTYMYASILKGFEEILPADKFIRVHRAYIVNIEAVTGLDSGCVLINKIEIPISKSRREKLYEFIKFM